MIWQEYPIINNAVSALFLLYLGKIIIKNNLNLLGKDDDFNDAS